MVHAAGEVGIPISSIEQRLARIVQTSARSVQCLPFLTISNDVGTQLVDYFESLGFQMVAPVRIVSCGPTVSDALIDVFRTAHGWVARRQYFVAGRPMRYRLLAKSDSELEEVLGKLETSWDLAGGDEWEVSSPLELELITSM